MPRRQRVFVEGGTYHVYSRVTRRESVFDSPAEAQLFVNLLVEVKKRDGIVLFGWTLMPNHYHLLLRTVDVPLWRTMASLQGGFTKRFNKAHRLIGPFWQGRYKAKLVQDQRYFDQLLAYIHLNPVVAGLVSDPAEYRYSGHREIVGKAKARLIDVGEVLVLFGGTAAQARRRYTRALRGAREASWIGDEPGRLPWWRWGRAPSTEEDLTLRSDLPFIDELGRSTGRDRPVLAAEQLVARACDVLEVDREDLAGQGQLRQIVRKREAVALIAVERFAVRAKDLAIALAKNQDTVSRWLSRAAVRRREDESFARLIDELDRELSADPR